MKFNKYLEKVYLNKAMKTAFENLMSQLIFDGKKVELKYDKKLMTEFALVVNKEIYCELTDFITSESNEKLNIYYNCMMATLLQNEKENNYVNDSRSQLNAIIDVIQKERQENEEKNNINGITKCDEDLVYLKNIIDACEESEYDLVDCLKSFNKIKKMNAKDVANNSKNYYCE